MSKKSGSSNNERPSMSDFGLISFVGNAPEWSEQGQKQQRFYEALVAYEEEEKKANKSAGS